MRDEVLEFGSRNQHLAGLLNSAPGKGENKKLDADSECCAAFGFLRGLQDRAMAVELRFRNGNREFFPYSWIGPWKHNPSAGVLLKFTGDMVTLVLVRGSNLDALVGDSAVNLTDRGLQRHRITFIREMDEDELRKAGQGEPTIDKIEIGEFESHEELNEWLRKTAPAFLRLTSG